MLLEYYPGGVYGVDKEGHPILYQLSKDFDPKGKNTMDEVQSARTGADTFAMVLVKLTI